MTQRSILLLPVHCLVLCFQSIKMTFNIHICFCRIEVNIKPWEALSKDLKEGNKRSNWMEREPYAYWKGNPIVAETRQDLLKCNVSENQDWNARLYAQVTHNYRSFHLYI